jgi:hypothetical protein
LLSRAAAVIRADNSSRRATVIRKSAMRWHLLGLAALSAPLFAFDAVRPAMAETVYPVCMAGGYDSRALHCDYTDLDQCRATASGIGGSCTLNPYYHAAPPAVRGPTRRRR